ncbi:MAG TPA: hypothetical protein VLH75_02910 [Longimicrobiales bacterium]|nr:hypothetical protein [Longimicrobiales bacterium]
MKRLLSPALVAGALLLAGCGGAGDEPAAEPQAEGAEDAAASFRGRIYERNLVFMSLSEDSSFVVPWLMSSQTRPGSVHRSARGLVARSGTWEEFHDDTWDTPPTRTPWRILPQGSLRLLVGEGDAVEAVIFSQGQRQLEVEVTGGLLMEWTGTRGQVYRLHDGAAYLSDQRLQGLVLDMSRVHGAEEAAQGDWAFLASGDSLQVILENPEASAPNSPGAYRIWARLEYRDLQWPAVSVDWADVSAFEPARQDIPVSWTISTDDGGVAGVLQVQAAHVEAGQGAGPLLPVDALFLVVGTLRVEGRTYPVHGLFRHTRP